MSNILGSRIRLLRENKGLNQIELSSKLNVSNTTLSQYENGIRIPSDDIKMKISEFFNVSIDYLLGKTDIKNLSYNNISPLKQELMDIIEDLPPEDINRVKEYAELLKLKRKDRY